jgi:hypothetical protein
MGEIDLLILNFRPNNFVRFVILQKIRHTAKNKNSEKKDSAFG